MWLKDKYMVNESIFMSLHVRWVDLVWLPDTHPAAHSLPLLKRTEEKNKMLEELMSQDKDRKILYQLPSRIIKTQLEDN